MTKEVVKDVKEKEVSEAMELTKVLELSRKAYRESEKLKRHICNLFKKSKRIVENLYLPPRCYNVYTSTRTIRKNEDEKGTDVTVRMYISSKEEGKAPELVLLINNVEPDCYDDIFSMRHISKELTEMLFEAFENLINMVSSKEYTNALSKKQKFLSEYFQRFEELEGRLDRELGFVELQ